jgi:3-methylfumaryl-CoA hydratase
MNATSSEGVSFADWIGRSWERRDTLTPRLAAEFDATLTPHLAQIAGARPGSFWTLAPDIEPASRLGGDGHPRLGIFLPPLPFARRMWAGGELHFEGSFDIGDEVVKTSAIEDIAFKTGASGPLAFVVVRHRYSVGGRRFLDERQDIVYRAPAAENAPQPAKAAPPAGEAARVWEISVTPTMLMRYSATTFNGHRIHYDAPYARDVEGYAGLVVHGPMQATLMLNIAADILGRLPKSFRYRGLAPLICGAPFRVEAMAPSTGQLSTRVISAEGVATMSATVEAD